VVNTKGVNTVNLYESIRTFDSLYYKALWKRILGRLRHHRHRLLPLAPWWEVTGTGEATYRGIKAVPIAQIVGTENRFSDFDREFLPLKRRDRHRWARIHALYEEGKPLPPVSLVKIGDFYFVRDGHHRISAARASGALYIDAEVVEISIPQDAPQDSPEALFHYLEERAFREKTGLSTIRVTVPGGYLELLRLIQCFQHSSCPNAEEARTQKGHCLSWEEAVSGWYEHCYLGAVKVIEESGILRRFPNRTPADFYLFILENLDLLRKAACFVPSRRTITQNRWKLRQIARAKQL
jgi:hypothetical protein